MANPADDMSLPPLTKDDMENNMFPLPTPDDILQLQADTANVMEDRVSLDSFDPEYQERIKNYS